DVRLHGVAALDDAHREAADDVVAGNDDVRLEHTQDRPGRPRVGVEVRAKKTFGKAVFLVGKAVDGEERGGDDGERQGEAKSTSLQQRCSKLKSGRGYILRVAHGVPLTQSAELLVFAWRRPWRPHQPKPARARPTTRPITCDAECLPATPSRVPSA